jgi:hypothetical protein
MIDFLHFTNLGIYFYQNVVSERDPGLGNIKNLNLNSVAFSPQANYTDRATAACRRS